MLEQTRPELCIKQDTCPLHLAIAYLNNIKKPAMVCIVQLPYFPSLKACSESCHDSSVALVRNVSSFIFSNHWLPELGTTTQLTTGISNVLPFLLTQVAEMLIFPSESSWADSCYPGCSFLCFVLLVAIGVGFFPWGRSVNMGRSRKPTVSFFNFIFFSQNFWTF